MEHLPAPSGPGSVVLDIGGDVGAAIVYTDASLDGEEIEIRRVGDNWDGTHVAVRARVLPERTVYAAVFESLRCGHYEVRIRDDSRGGRRATLEVAGGRVVAEQLGS